MTRKQIADRATECRHCHRGSDEVTLYGDECFACGWQNMAR